MRIFTPILFSCFLLHSIGFSQQLSFQNYNIGEGLSQSQVNSIGQDHQRHLWIGTIAGLDRFDGTVFQHYTKNDGLQSSSITCVYTALNGSVWAGTFKGVSCYDGHRIYNFPVQEGGGNILISTIAEDPSGIIWIFDRNRGLFRFEEDSFVKVPVPFPGSKATCLYRDNSGQLLVNFYGRGIYRYRKEGWIKISNAIPESVSDYIISLNGLANHRYAFTSGGRVIKLSTGMDAVIAQNRLQNISVSCIDDKGNVWVGTNKGVIVCDGITLSVIANYSASSGLTDNYIRSLYKDNEGNIWIGSDGEGLFKFSGSAFLKYDRSNGMPGNIVMGFALTADQQLYMGIRETGLVRFDLSTQKIHRIDYSSFSSTGINCIGSSHRRTVLVGTLDNKLLEYKGNTFREIIIDRKSHSSIISILATADRTWINTSSGCYFLRSDSITRVEGIEGIPLGPPLSLEKDLFLIGSSNGVYYFRDGSTGKKINHPLLKNLGVSCFGSYKDYVVVGTMGDGIFLWNRKSEQVFQCNVQQGLSDNQVFTLFTDRNHLLWAGTGTGLNQVFFDERTGQFRIKKFSKKDGYENAENNLTAITEDPSGRIWIGTNKGVFVYTADTLAGPSARPLTVIQRVEYPDRQSEGKHTAPKVSPWYHLPFSPTLSYSNNKISFSVKGIYFKDPSGLLYSSQLVGYDKDFSPPSPQSFFNYQSLEPGSYIFRVKAISAEGESSGNIAEYPFRIKRPFHKTIWFYLLSISIIFTTGILSQFLHTRYKRHKKRKLDSLRYEEQQKIRQQTSEDFHDELGNKLTRISLLTDILQKKIGGNAEQTNLTSQIKENILALYAGTRDIIWSLSPGSNQLGDILNRIRQFGEDLFQDSDIDFVFESQQGPFLPVTVPMDYSRNLIMIFKELLTNTLRHSKATQVSLTVTMESSGQLEISLRDNGKGYQPEQVPKGNGLNNIQRRAVRLNARLSIQSVPGQGTEVIIRLKIPLKGG